MFSHLKEPEILKKITKYNFVPQLVSSFQDYDYLYLVTTYYEGKNFQHFRKNNMTEEQIKFVSACVIQALEYLRNEQIIHRDVCPVNIIMDSERYFNLIDFSFSIEYQLKSDKKLYLNTYDMVTPPEMLLYSEYDYDSDYYRLGSIIYYLIFKKYPLITKREFNITDIKVDHNSIKNYSYNCIDFMNKLLITDYKKRLGFNDINELKNHSWFKDFDWIQFKQKKIRSPFKFIKNEINQSRCNKLIISTKNIIGYEKYSKRSFYKSLITNFDFSNKDVLSKDVTFA